MAISYFNETVVMGKRFSKNHFRVKKIRDKYLLTTDHGSWVALDKKEYDAFIRDKLDDGLFKILEEKGVILTPQNFNIIIEDYRKRLSGVFQGTSLHILTPTIRCNLKCGYCHSNVKSELSNEKYDMSKDTMDKTLDFIFQSPNNHITIEFQGGETLLRVDLLKYIVKKAKKMNKKYKKKVNFALVSNLTLMNDSLLSWLQKEGVNICTSLDGPKELHDKNRWFEGGGASYDGVTYWIKKIKEKTGRPPGMLMVTTKHSIPLWKEIVDEYIKWGHTSLQLKHMNKIGFAELSWKQIGYTMDEFLDFWKNAVDYMIELNKKGIKIKERFVTLILKKSLTKYDPNFVDWRNPTGEIIGAMAYDHKGDIFASDEGRMNDLFKLGNVHNDNYKDIISSEKSQQILGASINDNYAICDACVYKPWCGLDPVVIHAEQGSIIPKISDWSKHKLYEFQFNYVFEKLLFDEGARHVFFDWLNDWGDSDHNNNLGNSIKQMYGVEVVGEVEMVYYPYIPGKFKNSGRDKEENVYGMISIDDVRNGALTRVIMDGGIGCKKLFKIYPNRFENERSNRRFMVSIVGWVNFLRKNKMELGRILPTKKGENYIAMGDNFGILHEYIEGGKFGGSDEELLDLANKLSKMHNILKKYVGQGQVRDFSKIFQGICSESINIEKRADVGFSDVYPKFKKIMKIVLKDINDLLKKENYSKLEKLCIHGDFKLDNIIYKDEKVNGIIDFDALMYGPKMFDLAVLFCSLIFRYKEDSIEKINSFYQEYKKNSEVNVAENEVIIKLMKMRIIEQIFSRLINEVKKKEIMELIEWFYWVEKNEKKLKKYLN